MDSPLSSAERPRLTADCHLGAPRHRNWHVIGLPAGIKIVPGQQKKADRNVARGVVPGSAGDECGRDAEAPGRRRAPPWRPGRGDFILKVTQWKRGVAADKWFPSPYQALSLSTTRPNISPSSSLTILYTVHFVLRILRPGWMENVEIFLVRSSLSSIFSAIARFFLRLALFWFIGCLRLLYLRRAGSTQLTITSRSAYFMAVCSIAILSIVDLLSHRKLVARLIVLYLMHIKALFVLINVVY